VDAEEVGARIRSDHDALRARLREIESLAQRFEAGEETVGALLREHGEALYEAFAAHLRLEDHLLVAALAALPDERARRMATRLSREHEEQRELLAYLLERLREQSRPTLLVARELQGFAHYLRDDMGHEESRLLPQLYDA
jgi:hemerythrin-like domain-containing protein